MATADEAVNLFVSVDRDPAAGAVLIDFYEENGPRLTIGAGRAHSALCYQTSVDPPYFASLGDEEVDECPDFSYGGSFTDFPPRNLIDKSSALAALCEFIETRRRPQTVEWEEV